MAGTSKILRAGFFVDCREDGDGAVGGADAGGDAGASVNGFGEGGAVDASVDGRHQRKMKLFAALLGKRQADEATAESSHEIDSFGRDFFGSQGQVAFVFAVFVVNQDDHAALADLIDCFFDGGEQGRIRSHGVYLEGIV